MMSETVEKLLPGLIALPAKDRATIAESLLSTLPDENSEDAAFMAELDRRLERHSSGQSPGIPAEEAFRRLREKYP